MKLYLIAFACLLLFQGLTCSAQNPATTPAPTNAGTPVPIRPTIQTIEYERQKARTTSGQDAVELARENQRLMEKFIEPLYRKPTEAELAALSIDPAIRQIFSQFLSLPNTGIIKLRADFGCGDEVSAVSVSEECRLFTMPGAGNAFSFRTRNYQMHRLADIAFRGAKFVTPGMLGQGIFIKLGDVPIENLSLADERLKYLIDLRPAEKMNDVLKAAREFETGVDSGGVNHVSSAPVEINVTYALRSIAYRGESVRVIQGAIFNELEYDKRRDSIVVFRTVGFEKNGSLILLWRELKNTDSPKIKYSK